MVRNKTGGSKHKKQARKNDNQSTHTIITRLRNVKESCEMYAIVSRMLGHGNCYVKCNDGVTRLCIIRKKFRQRHKRSNMVQSGSYVLVGLRDWEVQAVHKIEKCDLLEVYDRKQHDDIKVDPDFNAIYMKDIYSNTSTYSKNQDISENSRYVFDRSASIKVDVDSMPTATTEKSDELDTLYDINIDDI
jgi:initiation factor 1A